MNSFDQMVVFFTLWLQPLQPVFILNYFIAIHLKNFYILKTYDIYWMIYLCLIYLSILLIFYNCSYGTGLVLYTVLNIFIMCLLHRCGSTSCLYHIGLSIFSATLWDPSHRISLCPSCDNMAVLHQCYWIIQYLPLESSCLSGTLSILHVQIPEKDSERRLDVLGWHLVMHNR